MGIRVSTGKINSMSIVWNENTERFLHLSAGNL